MHVIAGLGNPGSQYEKNRHNIGFMAIDAIARASGAGPFRQKFSASVADATIAGEKVLLIKPQTFMNRSGDAIAQALKFYKLGPADLTVLYDELDLVPGKVRIKRGGGNGGHNGLRSIDPQVGLDYRRVRLGIGHPGHKDLVTNHVLGDFAKADARWLEPLLECLGANAAMIVAGDDAGLMNRIALALGEPAPKTAAPRETKGRSHVRAAREAAGKPEPTGAMADMLKRLLGRD